MTIKAHIPLDELVARMELIAQTEGVHATFMHDGMKGPYWYCYCPEGHDDYGPLTHVHAKSWREACERIIEIFDLRREQMKERAA